MAIYETTRSSLIQRLASALTPSRSNKKASASLRFVSWTAAVGLSLVVLKLVGSALKETKAISSYRKSASVIYEIVGEKMRQWLESTLSYAISESKEKSSSQEDAIIVTNQGSCHCGSVVFKVR